MNNNSVRILLVFLIVVFSLYSTQISAVATSEPLIAGEVVTSKPNNTVKMEINLSSNPGIVSATINVSFDSSALSLTKVTDGGLLGVQSHKPEYTSPYTLAWVNDTATKNFTSNGTIATLTFRINDSAIYGKTYPVKISYDYNNYDIYDKDLNTVKIQTINGAVKISQHGFILGDADKDSKITISDAICIQRYIAHIKANDSFDVVATDIDEDGQTSIIDVTLIQRYLSNLFVLYPIGRMIE